MSQIITSFMGRSYWCVDVRDKAQEKELKRAQLAIGKSRERKLIHTEVIFIRFFINDVYVRFALLFFSVVVADVLEKKKNIVYTRRRMDDNTQKRNIDILPI